MELFEHISAEVILFFILYGISGAVPAMAAIYLLLRRGNAFAPDVTPPMRLRCWAASFFAFSSLTHVWWLLFFYYSFDIDSVYYQMLVVLDCILMFTTITGTMLSMLQDRRRPLWPILASMIPFVALGAASMAYPSELLLLIGATYFLLLCLLFTLYMVFAIRQYGRWLNDNYADLENKKVWLSQVVAFFCLLLFVLYIAATGIVLICLLHIIDLVLVGLLLWRVESLPTLTTDSLTTDPSSHLSNRREVGGDTGEGNVIEQLLEEYCVATQLYLQHDLSLQQLAQAIGTNRTYLSQYFSCKGVTYNTYINDLRINHFISRYQEVTATRLSFTVQQLAIESGYRSYSTFSRAFIQRTGQSVAKWMGNADK